MRKRKVSEELIEQATAFNETDDNEILEARKMFKELKAKFDETIKEEKQKVIEAGGLKIIGTERHESRRIDNQLRGRSGRQGDNGESRFYIGLDDDLMKIFGGDMITNVYETLGADENIPIEAKMISNAVERAQKRVEGQNLENNIKGMLNSTAEEVVHLYLADGEHSNKEALVQEVRNIFDVDISDDINNKNKDVLINKIREETLKTYENKEKEIGEEQMRELERVVMLKVVDQKWMDHIDSMDELKNGIGLRAYGQKNPVDQYRIEGFDMFDEMVVNIKLDVVKLMLHIEKRGEVEREQTIEITKAAQENLNRINFERSQPPAQMQTEKPAPVVNNGPDVGRNDPCPCGSGKKYKNCCGK